jgi:hypothetical protein
VTQPTATSSRKNAIMQLTVGFEPDGAQSLFRQ